MAKENKIRKCPENFQEVQQFSDYLEMRTNYGKPKENTSKDRIDGYRIDELKKQRGTKCKMCGQQKALIPCNKGNCKG